MHSNTLNLAQLNGILSIADDAIICADAGLTIILFNRGAERLFGCQAKEMTGQPLDVLLPPRFRDGHSAHIAQFSRAGEQARPMGKRRDIFAMRKDGSEFPAEASISQLATEHGEIYTVMLRDISVRIADELALRQAKETAEAAVLAKGMFLANMSHEIRTPLNAVIGMTTLLLNTHIDDEQRDYAQTIRASGEVLLGIINDILDFSKIDVGKLELERHPFDLRHCVEAALDLLSASACEKHINLAYFIGDSVPAVLVSDVTRVRQILVNLLSNAIKFTHQGEVVVTVSATMVDAERHEITFAVRDTGIGIPAAKVPELFESFTQADASTTRKYGGTGLGLTISRRLTEVMGGRMWVESEFGVGSTFSFTITTQASGPRLAHTLLQERSSALLGKRVLIVDDNSTNRRILVKQTLLWGMLPSAALSALEALDFVRHGQAFDVAILDVSMPDMNGLMLGTEIRSYRSAEALPLVMLTSVAHRSHDLRVAQVKFAACLAKPIKPSALFDVLHHAMKIGPQAAQAAQATIPLAGRLGELLPLKILVAEDNAVNQKVVQRLLAHLGYHADVVANGLEALTALERQSYDVVLMDVQMPLMDGLEATRRLRLRYGAETAPRVIAMTANAMPGDRERCLMAGMDAYVAKPVELTDLRRVLIAVATPVEFSANGPDVIDGRRLDQLRELEDESNPTLVADIAALFISDAPRHLKNIARALALQDGMLLEASAHRFLSGIDNLGAQRMHGHCVALERMGKQGQLDDSAPLLLALQREFEIARHHLLGVARASDPGAVHSAMLHSVKSGSGA